MRETVGRFYPWNDPINLNYYKTLQIINECIISPFSLYTLFFIAMYKSYMCVRILELSTKYLQSKYTITKQVVLQELLA
jgi:hypothetical protein